MSKFKIGDKVKISDVASCFYGIDGILVQESMQPNNYKMKSNDGGIFMVNSCNIEHINDTDAKIKRLKDDLDAWADCWLDTRKKEELLKEEVKTLKEELASEKFRHDQMVKYNEQLQQELNALSERYDHILNAYDKESKSSIAWADRWLQTKKQLEQEKEIVGYVNGDELDNMLNDRCATISPVRNTWYKTPIYR